MKEIPFITEGLDFTYRIKAQRLGFNKYVNVSFEEISGLTVNHISLPSTKTPVSYSIDEYGRLIIPISGEGLACNTYGLELTGFYNNGNWRRQEVPTVEIVKASSQDNYALQESDDRTIDITITLGETTVSSRVFQSTIDAMRQNIADSEGVGDVKINGRSIVETNPITGKKEVNLQKDMLGKVDDVKVNGESVLNEANEANIVVPTTVEELSDSSDFAKKTDLQDLTQQLEQSIEDAAVSEVEATVDNNTGTPEVDYTFENGKIQLDFRNLKGEKGDKLQFSDLNQHEKDSLKGAPGESAVFDPNTGNIAVIEQSVGDSTTNPMSQKATTDAIENRISHYLDSREYVQSDLIAGHFYKANNVGTATEYGSVSSASCLLLECKQGDIFSLITYAKSATCPYLFLDENMVILAKSESGSFEGEITAPANTKYLAVNLYSNNAGYDFWLKAEAVYDKIGVLDGKVKPLASAVLGREYVKSDLTVGPFYQNKNVGEVATTANNSRASSMLVECKQGDVFYLKTTASGSQITYLLLDEDMIILAKGNSGSFDGEIKVTNPNAKYLAVNLFQNDVYDFSLKEEGLPSKVDEMTGKVVSLESTLAGRTYLQADLIVEYFYFSVAVGTATSRGHNNIASCLLLECKQGDSFYLKTFARSSTCPYLFLDENMIVLEKADSGAFDGKITATNASTKYLAVNLYSNNQGYEFLLKEDGLAEKVEAESKGLSVTWTLPNTIYAIKGLEKSIYFDNIVNRNDDAPNYCLQVFNKQFGNADARRFYFTENSVASKSLAVIAIDSNNQTIDSRTISFKVLDNVLLAEKRICCIGDSITEKHNMPYYVEECLKRVLTQESAYPIFVGTKGGVNGGYDGLPTKHEGYYGRSYQWLASDSASPFVNPSTGLLDISYYKTERLGMESTQYIDVVSLAMGYNGVRTKSDANDALAAMQNIIEAFKADNADTKFIVHLATYPAMGNYDNTNEFGRVEKKNSILYFRKLCLDAYNDNQDQNIVIGDMGLGYDRWFAYPRTSRRPVSYYDNDRVDVITDYTHPSAAGTKQIGENIAAVILKMLQDEE